MSHRRLADRIQTLTWIFIGACVLLTGRLWFLQMVKGDTYHRLAQANRERSITYRAPRGAFLDRHGQTIASNRIAYSVSVVPSGLYDPDGSITNDLSGILGLSPDEIRATLAKGAAFPYEPIVVARDVPIEVVVAVEEARRRLPGIFVEEEWVRDYPFGALAGQTLGYLGEADQTDVQNGYRPKDMVGRAGLERAFEAFLRGEAGERRVEVNALSRAVRELHTVPPKPGMDVRLTIDLNIQLAAERILHDGLERVKEQAEFDLAGNGAVVVLDAKTGGVLAIASAPSFDLSQMQSENRSAYYTEIINDANRPMLNRAMLAYPPGSVYKVVTALAGLESGAITPTTVYNATGYGPYGRRDWTIGAGLPPAGPVTVVDALARSANDFFWDLALKPEVGNANLQRWAEQLGLGRPVGLPLGEATGFVPSIEHKRETQNLPWYPLDTMNVAIGQGDVMITPLQLAQMYLIIANEGIAYDIHIVESVLSGSYLERPGERVVLTSEKPRPSAARVVSASPSSWRAVKDGLRRVVQWDKGTAYFAFLGAKYDPAGKTGSAETGRVPHAWFVGFAPAERPEIVVAAFAEYGESGARVAPIVREIMDVYFELYGNSDRT